jgi:hypothetical protein
MARDFAEHLQATHIEHDLKLYPIKQTLICIYGSLGAKFRTMTRAKVPTSITIRPAYADDQASLARLAALDSAAGVPASPVLVAEVDDVLRAALSLADETVIADPFFATQHLVRLLQAHASSVTENRASRTRRPLRRSRRLRTGFAAG